MRISDRIVKKDRRIAAVSARFSLYSIYLSSSVYARPAWGALGTLSAQVLTKSA